MRQEILCKRNIIAFQQIVTTQPKQRQTGFKRASGCSIGRMTWAAGELSSPTIPVSFLGIVMSPSRQLARDTLNDLIISIFLAVAIVTTAGLLDRLWNAF